MTICVHIARPSQFQPFVWVLSNTMEDWAWAKSRNFSIDEWVPNKILAPESNAADLKVDNCSEARRNNILGSPQNMSKVKESHPM